MQAGKGVNGAVTARAVKKGTHCRVQVLRMLIDKLADPREPLREPWPVIKKRPDFLKWPVIDGGNLRAGPPHGFYGKLIKRGVLCVPVELTVFLRKHANAGTRSEALLGAMQRIGVELIKSFGNAADARAFSDAC